MYFDAAVASRVACQTFRAVALLQQTKHAEPDQPYSSAFFITLETTDNIVMLAVKQASPIRPHSRWSFCWRLDRLPVHVKKRIVQLFRIAAP